MYIKPRDINIIELQGFKHFIFEFNLNPNIFKVDVFAEDIPNALLYAIIIFTKSENTTNLFEKAFSLLIYLKDNPREGLALNKIELIEILNKLS